MVIRMGALFWAVNAIPLAKSRDRGLIARRRRSRSECLPRLGATETVDAKRENVFLGLSLVFAIALWGGNNTGTKLIVAHWPPFWTGGFRVFFFCLFFVSR